MPTSSSRPSVVSIDAGGHRERLVARRNALVESHLHLVRPIALKVAMTLPPSFDLDDLIATGNLALINVATRYRPKLHGDAPFATFARPRIRGAILDSIRRRHWTANTCVAIDATPEPWADPVVEMNTSFDTRRMRTRLLEAIARLPKVPRNQFGDFISLAAALAELHEWRLAGDHVQAIADMRRKAA